MSPRETALLLVSIVALGSACARSRLEIQFVPMTPVTVAYNVNVGLRVVDARPLEKGGMDKARVGTIRNSYGIPTAIRDEHPDVALRTVADATADALRRGRVGVGAAPKTLVVSITEYWMDGYVGYGCRIAVQYFLVDTFGQTRWSVAVNGGGSGMGWHGPAPGMQWSSMSRGRGPRGGKPKTLVKDLFEEALDELAYQAGAQFLSPAFQQALVM